MRQLIQLLSISTFCIIWGCGGCPDDSPENFLLTEEEKQLIGFNAKQVVFINENNQELIAEYSSKQNLVTNIQASDDEDCFPLNLESLFIFMNFKNDFEEFNVSLKKNATNTTSLLIIHGNESLSLNDCDGLIANIPESRNIMANGFQFSDVLEFKNCIGSGKVIRILYSPDIGIKYIEFNDKTFLALKQ
ncbi:MAG: hypothetical protein ABGX00_07115 [Allomuricauda sp.]